MVSTETIKEPAVNLNVYCQSKSLLFQFILSEFLTTQKAIHDIEELYLNTEGTLIKKRLHADIEESFASILDLIPLLTGTQMVIANEQAFPWTQDKGCLNKLRHYCFLLSQMWHENSDVANMNIRVSKAFHSSLQLKEVVLSLKRESLDQQVANFIPLYQLLDKLVDNMRMASRLILKIILQFKDNENVIYFLLRHQQEFNRVYKTHFVKKILEKMYPEGIKKAKDIVLEKYVKRGFGNLVEKIQALFVLVDEAETL